jgi:hypothetical protein
MQTSFPGKDAFHRVPNSAHKGLAICHLPLAISGSACLRPSLRSLRSFAVIPAIGSSVSSCSALRATIFGACNSVGSAGHARRSDNKQKQ